MTNFIFPLPPNKLHERYDPVFKALKNGLSSTLIGLPLSGRSAFLKFILSQNEEKLGFLHEFIEPKQYRFILLEDQILNQQALIKKLVISFITSDSYPTEFKKLIEKYLATDDYFLLSTMLLKGLESIHNKLRIILVFYQAEIQLQDTQSLELLGRIWRINRNVPNPLISFVFIGSAKLLEVKSINAWNPIRPALEENVNFFPIFDDEEMDYLRKRIECLTNRKIEPSIHRIAAILSGGHDVLYKTLINLPLNELKNLKRSLYHPAIETICQKIWESIPHIAKLNWNAEFLQNHPSLSPLRLIKDGKFAIPVIPPKSTPKETDQIRGTIPQLTAQQKLIFDYLFNHLDQIITRDEVAQVIWGRAWNKKYSDWAIDKSLSNLRKKLHQTSWQIIAIRNRGYQLKEL